MVRAPEFAVLCSVSVAFCVRAAGGRSIPSALFVKLACGWAQERASNVRIQRKEGEKQK